MTTDILSIIESITNKDFLAEVRFYVNPFKAGSIQLVQNENYVTVFITKSDLSNTTRGVHCLRYHFLDNSIQHFSLSAEEVGIMSKLL